MIKTKVGNVFIDEFGFCRVEMKNNRTDSMGEVEANEVCEAIYSACNGVPIKLLTDTRGVYGTVQPGARKIIRYHPEMLKIRAVEAFIVDSLPNRLLAHFYIRFNKPPNPTRIFNNEKAAVEWLKSVEI